MTATTRGPAPVSALRRDQAVVIDCLRRLVRAIRRGGNEAEKRTGVSGAQLFVLQQLADGQPKSMGEIAARTLTHQSTVSVVVARLARKGLVVRHPDPADRRRVMLSLSASGRTLLRRAPEPVQALLVESIAKLPPKDVKLLARHLRTLVRDVGAADHRVEMFLELAD